MRLLTLTGFIIVSVSFADISTQTDWSGGDGVGGPVNEWNNTYYVADQVNATGSFLGLASSASDPVETIVQSNYDGARSVYATDIDGDGDKDILSAATFADDITWWENSDTSPGIVWTEHLVDGYFDGASSAFAADVDGDGDTDIIGAALWANEITWWENIGGTGTSWTEHTVDNFFDGARLVYATDVDGDGDIDILGVAYDADDISWWENTEGAGTSWTKHTVSDNFNGAHSVYGVDLDGDGDTDILGAAYSASDITWWENTDGSGTSWTEYTVDSNFSAASSVYATDVDGDGDTDIIGAAFYADDVAWWENTDGSGTSWTKHTVSTNFDGAWSVYAVDLDGDGDTDIVAAAFSGSDITWWENSDEVGTTWTEHAVDTNFNLAISVYATDVDGDGTTDILGAALSADQIKWWDVLAFSEEAYLESSILDVGILDTWQYFSSNEEEPTGTSVGFQFRSSNDSSDMGEWSDTSFTLTTNLSGILADSTNFVQYRAILQTTDPSITPVLNNVTIFYLTYVSIDDANHQEIINWELSPIENPSYGNPSIQVSVPQTEVVNLLLYDAAGRLVAQHSQELTTGQHSYSFNNLSSGVYFCQVRAGDFTATERLVVLD